MRKRLSWLVVSCLAVVVLLAGSCARAPEKEVAPAPVAPVTPAAPVAPAPAAEVPAPVEKPGMVKLTLTKLDGTTVEKLMEKPKYGGTLTTAATTGLFMTFDPLKIVEPTRAWTHFTTYDKLGVPDWYRGPSGTGEASFVMSGYFPWDTTVPLLAERWEIVDNQTIIYYLRKGVYFQNKAPANGREMVAADVVFSIKRAWEEPSGYLYNNFPRADAPVSIRPIDKYTVEVKSRPGVLIHNIHEAIIQDAPVYPPEVITKYGDLLDWRNAVGTGPFILTDYVPLSSATLVRNPNWFWRDPFFPENQLPYIDTCKFLIIDDQSTVDAAFRAGKIDWISYTVATYESILSVLKTNPEAKWGTQVFISPCVLHLRQDKPELPWAGTVPYFPANPTAEDISARKVRWAMNMAIDREGIVKDYFKGQADLLCVPVIPVAEYRDMFTPLEQLPPQIREIYTYNPAKAKQLLAEAGYPQGFKMKVDAAVAQVEELSIYKEYFAAIGIDMEIKAHTPTVWGSLIYNRGHEQALYNKNPMSFVWEQWAWNPLNTFNGGFINDPIINQWLADLKALIVDDAARRKLMKEKLAPYGLEQAYLVLTPTSRSYRIWHPWLKGYNDEGYLGKGGLGAAWASYVWLDPELKRALGYR